MTTQTPALPFPVTPRRPGEPEADLTGFTLIHRALRSGTRDLAVAASAIGAGAPCPAARREAHVAFATEVLHEIDLHHTREDDVLWPVIAASAGAVVDLEPLTDDHTELHAVLARAEEALRSFAAAADVRAAAAVLVAVLTDMADLRPRPRRRPAPRTPESWRGGAYGVRPPAGGRSAARTPGR
jgi:hypothetical protein